MGPACVVAGAGGFIGGHLVGSLLERGRNVRAIDVKPLTEWQQVHAHAENLSADLASRTACDRLITEGAFVFNLAADMGGMGFIGSNDVACLGNCEISLNLLRASADVGSPGYLFASSACVYPASRQVAGRVAGLTEEEAYPAEPPEGYGWEKLFAERLARAFASERGLSVRLPRLHNVYGPKGTWSGGREKAPAALTRKVVMAKLTGAPTVPIWGDGTQIRSFLHVDDCVRGLVGLALDSRFEAPINLGSDVAVTIEALFRLVCDLVGVVAAPAWQHGAPVGVASRIADVSLAESVLGWRPTTALRDGMKALVDEVERRLDEVPRVRVVEAVRSGVWDL